VSMRSLVVVAVDGSPETEATVEYAVSVASMRGAELHAVQVVPRDDGALWIAPRRETTLRARLRALRPLAEREGVSFRIVTVRGVAERSIPAYAQLVSAGVVVVGRNYATSPLWRGMAVASRLSRHSPVPVIVVPPEMKKTASSSLKHVVTAVDFTVASAMALRASVDLSKRHGTSLTMVHAMEAPDPVVFSGVEARRMVRRLRGEAKELAGHLKRRAIALGYDNAHPAVVTGPTDRGILDIAAKTGADLIVMGVAPRTWIDEAVFGSTLRGVLRRAKTPVLVLPVVAGGHEWIDVVNEDGAAATSSTLDAMVRRAA
jgi:nucleotide-binding universal stress UspA family protein